MIKVSNRRVVFTPIFESEKYGSLYIPDTAKSRCVNGIVKYCGPAVKDVKIGDHIFFGGYSGTFVNTEDEGMVGILDERFIYGVVSNDNKMILNGIYFKDKNGNYFNATYEDLFNIVAMNLEQVPSMLPRQTSRKSGIADPEEKVVARQRDDWQASNYFEEDDDD
jgi:co-chaperonin GroES (HSP10)